MKMDFERISQMVFENADKGRQTGIVGRPKERTKSSRLQRKATSRVKR